MREGELDAARFEGLVEDARQAMAGARAQSAATILREALALWRGPALAELSSEPFAAAEIARLHEQRLAALELRVEADLAAGRHAEVVGELQTLVVDNPLREQLAAQLMLALYRCGRQTEALEAYTSARRTLVEQMGLEPGPQLRERHEAILRQDASLQAQPARVQLPAALDPSNAQPLVGREEELGWLLAHWQVARNSGGGALVALAGPRGAGMPRRVHEAASQWARREAARHPGAVADAAPAGRGDLRTLEAELSGGIADLRERRRRFEPGRDDTPVVCPFKGLATFDAADARYFYGRERLVAELVARLVGAPLLGVVGPSGSGKSSAMRACLLPALAAGVLPGSDTWTQVLIRPGRHPVRELAAALDDVDGGCRVVLGIDQFEETFTVCEDEAERAEFISEVVRAALDPHRRYAVVIALRADCYGSCAGYPELGALLAENNVLVGPMARDELREAIEGPCERARLGIEHELVDALIDDVEREPGGLPLLSASLLELWQHRDGRRLRHGTYVQTGGVHGAVARLAEDAFSQFDEAQQAVGRRVLMRLVGTGEGDAIERRRIALDELEIGRDEDAARVVALLTDRRLLTVGAGFVELAHESLLREWPRLRGWIEDDRDGLRIHRGLRVAADEWARVLRDGGALYRGTRLTEALDWRDSHGPALTELERSS